MLFSRKIPSHIAERYPVCYDLALQYLLFEAVCHFSHYSTLFALFIQLAARHSGVFAICNYPVFAIRVFQKPQNNWYWSYIAYKLDIYTPTVKPLTSWCDIQTGNFMFQCGLAEVKNNYINKSSHAKTYGTSISKTSTLYALYVCCNF